MLLKRLLVSGLGMCLSATVAAATPVPVPALVTNEGLPDGTLSLDQFNVVAKACAPSVDRQTLTALVKTESSFNPYAIGVVGGSLPAQPRSLIDALMAVNDLIAQGKNFSLGLGQINVKNLKRLGETPQSIFEPCRNLKAAAVILGECYGRALNSHSPEPQTALRGALSCYYSNNFTTGFRHGYVATVIEHARGATSVPIAVPALEPEEVSVARGSPNPWVVLVGDAAAEAQERRDRLAEVVSVVPAERNQLEEASASRGPSFVMILE